MMRRQGFAWITMGLFFVFAGQMALAQPAGGPPRFEDMDSDGDGAISKEEFRGPDRFFDRLDENSDGKVSEEEIESMRERFGRRGRDGGPGGPGGFDPAQMQERFLEMYKNVLEVTDEEWQVIEPRVKDVMEAQRKTMTMGFGFPGRGGQQQGLPEANELRETLQNSSASPEQIQKQLTEYRDAKKRAEEELDKAQDKLREVLSLRQEAQLVLMGALD